MASSSENLRDYCAEKKALNKFVRAHDFARDLSSECGCDCGDVEGDESNWSCCECTLCGIGQCSVRCSEVVRFAWPRNVGTTVKAFMTEWLLQVV